MDRSIWYLLLAVFCCACATFSNHPKVIVRELPSNVPETSELEKRITELYEAEMRQDWESWYDLTTLKSEISYEEFRKQYRSSEIDYKIILCGTKRFVVKPAPKEKKNIKALVAVEMDIEVEKKAKTEKIKDQTDYWVYTGDSWYWTWRGFPAD